MKETIDKTETEFFKIHKLGLTGIVQNYSYSRDAEIVVISIVLALILTAITYFFGNVFQILLVTLEILFDTIPTILGFLVAGFALMFGFGDKSFFIEASEIEDGTSLYLSNVHAFSFAILVMIFTLIFMGVIKILVNIPSPFRADILLIGHLILMTIVLFFTFYSLLLLYHATKNVFNLTITHHAFLNSNRKEDSN